MPNEFNGNDAPSPEKSKKRRSTTPKTRKSVAVTSDGAAAAPAPVKKTSRKKSTTSQPVAPEMHASEVAASNVSTMPTPSAGNTHERIRARAYEIYVERGGQHGFDQADWLRAEVEVLGKQTA
jgi:hypothetical protein